MRSPAKVRPDKQKVIDEVWTEARIREFLHTITPSQAGEPFAGDHDFFVLLRAYQAMRLEDFTKFLAFFEADGGDLAAVNAQGQTLAQFIGTHRKAKPFIEAMSQVQGL